MTDELDETEDLLQFLYLMPVGVVKFHGDGTIEMMNPVAAALLLSTTPIENLQNIYSALSVIAPDLREPITEFEKLSGTIIDQQRLSANVDNRPLVLSLTVNKVKHDVFMAVLTDVTMLAEQEEKLFADRQKFRAIFDHVRDYAIFTISLEGAIEEWNQSMQRYAGWLAEDVYGRTLEMFLPQDSPNLALADHVLTEAKRAGSSEVEGWSLKRDGNRLWANSVITALPDESGTVRGFVVVSRDITERKLREDRTRKQADVDPLTGAYNRRKGDELLTKEFNRRSQQGRPFAIMLMDIDHFKSVNDTFGHPAGDAVLCAMVQTCREVLRSIDILVRWGGEEFLVLLPDIDEPGAKAVAELVRTKVAEMEVAQGGGPVIRFTVSIGVAAPTSDTASELLGRSDAALYAAKAGGRNRVVVAA